MDKKLLNTGEAFNLLHEKMKNQNLRRHCYAVGKVLAEFYEHYKESGTLKTELTQEQWETAGILHDADWEITKDEPTRHTVELLEWMENYDVHPRTFKRFQIPQLKNYKTSGAPNST
ncbi:MAG: hypothetical protein KatS3mg101_0199 [Patescibacteria group bacterium]|nr:MAG: hypothetical protein KatS3mg101_0199 [Patescibacteria group bacterium]